MSEARKSFMDWFHEQVEADPEAKAAYEQELAEAQTVGRREGLLEAAQLLEMRASRSRQLGSRRSDMKDKQYFGLRADTQKAAARCIQALAHADEPTTEGDNG